MHSRLILDPVVRERAPVLQLPPGEDDALHLRMDSVLVLQLALDHVDGVRRIDLEGPYSALQVPHKNPKPPSLSTRRAKRPRLARRPRSALPPGSQDISGPSPRSSPRPVAAAAPFPPRARGGTRRSEGPRPLASPAPSSRFTFFCAPPPLAPPES
ncbi:hypothetical protein T484DRAFT_2917393, partial [Baffinella frigidus]